MISKDNLFIKGSSTATSTKEQVNLDIADPKNNQSRAVPTVATNQKLYTDVAYFKGVLVSIKHIRKEHLLLSRQVLLEFSEVKCHPQEQ